MLGRLMGNLIDDDFSVLDINQLLDSVEDKGSDVEIEKEQDFKADNIAIIGMAVRIAACDNLDEFWQLIQSGQRTHRALPLNRRNDVNQYLKAKGVVGPETKVEYLHESFLKNIDGFDYALFGMAKQEANLSDPNLRLLLETCWTALEHAGYSGESISGTDTGLFIGHSADFGVSYKDIIRELWPDAPEVSIVGNVKSMIASRLAYQLDLHGPTMMIDTACSSSLVALHQACNALKAGDCDMALAGTVKIDLIPIADKPEFKVGIKDLDATAALDGRTKTFDHKADGTHGAEGVCAFLLKPLEKALEDRDTIHGVILASAINQDGLSVGVTAPNPSAQESLILKALERANVPPESISYFEAHGTATKLGDPIEIQGIQRAFSHFTQKNQFCAIGSVKTNIGHMDSGAGLAGLAKVLLSMKHQLLPASINFGFPNQSIPFIKSPVYVNDRCQSWNTDDNTPRRAAINSFGLSGTNSHVIVEEAPQVNVISKTIIEALDKYYIFALSARSESTLRRILKEFRDDFKTFDHEIVDLCYTLAVGREHHSHRLAICFDSILQLRESIDAILSSDVMPKTENCFYGAVKIVEHTSTINNAELSREQKIALDEASKSAALEVGEVSWTDRNILTQLCEMYCHGATIPWRKVYRKRTCRRIPLATYAFEETRCWVESKYQTTHNFNITQTTALHPLIDQCLVETQNLSVFETILNPTIQWELGDHKVHGQYVLPGTAFIEMLIEIAKRISGHKKNALQFDNLVFLQPVVMSHGERKVLQIIVDNRNGENHSVKIVSKASDPEIGQMVHLDAALSFVGELSWSKIDIELLKHHVSQPMHYTQEEDSARGLEIGERWNGSIKAGWTTEDNNEVLVHLALPEKYQKEIDKYHYHPALLDTAVNSANHLLGDGGLYLPFLYRTLKLRDHLPSEFMVHVKKKSERNLDAFDLDVMLFDLDGHCLAKATDYTVKLVRSQFLQSSEALSPYQVIEFVKDTRPNEFSIITDDELPVIVIADSETDRNWPVSGNIIPILRAEGMLDFPSLFDMLSSDYKNGIKGIVLLPSNQHSSSETALDEGHPDQPAVEFFQLIKALLSTKLRCQSGCLVIASNSFSVTEDSGEIVPKMHALAALARIARMENPQLNICVIDDDRFSLAELNSYFSIAPKHDIWINRNGQRYLEKLSNLTAPQHEKINVTREGVYVITGGLGALGLAFAGHLSSKGQVNLALLGSSEFPDKHFWGTILDNENTNLSLKQKILAINAIESTGSIVDYYRVDVSDRQSMSDCFNFLRQSHLKINGVIHAAGRAGEGFIFSKSQETFSRVVTPKILGAQNLHVLTENDDLDFFILFSSVATVLRSPGQSDYTAANSYLDALAIARRAKGLKAHSICWPAWSEIGIAVKYNAVNDREFFSPIATVDGLRLIEPLFNPKNNLPPVIVISEINRNAQLSDIESLGIQLGESIKGVFKKHAQQKGVDHNSDLSDVIVHGAEDSAELTAVAKRWQNVLGVDEFNIDDSFSELGGNSILTIQLYQEFERKYPGVFDVVDLFTYTTLRDQRDHLERAINKNHASSNESSSTPSIDVDWMDDESLDHILAALESGSLSADDAHQLLGKELIAE